MNWTILQRINVFFWLVMTVKSFSMAFQWIPTNYDITWAASWLNQQNGMCAQLRLSLGNCPVWSESSLPAWRKLGSLATQLSAQRRLIRLGGCQGWSESSLGAHAILLVLSWGGSPFGELVLGSIDYRSGVVLIWATSWENLFMPYANNKSTDQPVHPCSLISAFVVHCLDSIFPLVSISKISSLYLAPVAVQAGLSLPGCKPRRQIFLWRDSFH